MNKLPKSVRVQVRARGEQPFPWAGELWQPEWREFEAAPAHVVDLLKAPAGRLDVRWPDDFVLPDGRRPAAPQKSVQEPRTAGERVIVLEAEAKAFCDRAVAAETELAEVRAKLTGEAKRWQDEHASVVERLRSLEADLQTSEKARVAAIEAATKAHASVAAAVKAAQDEAKAEIDTIKAKAAAEIEKTRSESDKLIQEALAEIDAKTKHSDAKHKQR